MIKKLAELKVHTTVDYKNKIVEALEDAGFTLVEEVQTYTETHYIIAMSEAAYLSLDKRKD